MQAILIRLQGKWFYIKKEVTGALSRLMVPGLRSVIDLGALVVEGATVSAAAGLVDGAGEWGVGSLLECCFAALESDRFLRAISPMAAPARIRTTSDTPTILPRDLGTVAGAKSSMEGRGFFARGAGGGNGADGGSTALLAPAASTVDWPQCGQAVVWPRPAAGNSMEFPQL